PCAPARLPPLALVAGLATRDAVARSISDAQVKWPNDVVVRKKKIAGILVEASLSGSNVDAVIVGVGVNVDTRTFPPEIADRATSIALEGGRATPRALMDEILASLDRDVPLVAARGLAPIHARLAAVDALRGERVRSDAGEGIAEG